MTLNHFVVGVYGYRNCSPVHLVGYTKENAERAKRWQLLGGFTNCHICTPHPTLRSTFVSVETGAHFEVEDRGTWTVEAWDQFMDHTWGPK